MLICIGNLKKNKLIAFAIDLTEIINTDVSQKVAGTIHSVRNDKLGCN